MKIRLVSWNVRGANDSSKRQVIKALIRSQRADLVFSNVGKKEKIKASQNPRNFPTISGSSENQAKIRS